MPSSTTLTSSGSLPSTESYLRRCAIVSMEPRSFTATKSMSAPACFAARKKFRPIRPKPLMPTRTVMSDPFLSDLRPYLRSGSAAAVDVPVLDAGLVALAAQVAGQLLGQDDRAVASAGAPDPHREVALALGGVGGQQEVEQVVELVEELSRGGLRE